MSAGHGFPTLSTGKNIACVSCTLYNMFSLEAYPSAPQGGLMSSKQVSAATRASASQFVSRCVLVALLSSTLATWTLTTHHPLRWTSFAIVSFAYIYIYICLCFVVVTCSLAWRQQEVQFGAGPRWMGEVPGTDCGVSCDVNRLPQEDLW